MFATLNSQNSARRVLKRAGPRLARAFWAGLVAACIVAGTATADQTTPADDKTRFLQWAEKAYLTAKQQYEASPTNSEAAWHYGRASFDRAEFATNDTERSAIAEPAIAAMRALVAQDPKLAAGHYYLAMNLGQSARTKLLGALTLVDEMEKEFKITRDLDPKFDHAGADRNLGSLYFEAPGWPASIGNHSLARKHFEAAEKLAPDYPENHLNLLAAEVKWNDTKGMRKELAALTALWPKAQAQFTGEEWASSWADWQARWADLKAKAEKLLASR